LVPKPGANYLVKGLLPKVGLALVWGPPKCGKSFWVFDLAMHVALGWHYRGRRIHGGAVVYCAFEGADGFYARAEAFRQRSLAEDHAAPPFYLMPARTDLIADHPELIGSIRLESAASQLPIACIVLDTLNRSLSGSESDDKDMAAYVKAADALRETFGCLVIVVHHCGIEASRPRGHTSLTGAADAQLAVKREGPNFSVTVEYMKDSAEGEIVLSRLEQVEVGTDADGDAITSCVVVPVDETEARAAPNRWSRGLRLVHEAITASLAEAGFQHVVAGSGPTVTAVFVEDARDLHRQRYVHGGDGDRAEAERKAWARNIRDARNKGLIGSGLIDGREAVWLISG
jgi:hypothetical protein